MEVKRITPSERSKVPLASHTMLVQHSLDILAIARNVNTKQFAAAAISNVSGDHKFPGPSNSAGGIRWSRKLMVTGNVADGGSRELLCIDVSCDCQYVQAVLDEHRMRCQRYFGPFRRSDALHLHSALCTPFATGRHG